MISSLQGQPRLHSYDLSEFVAKLPLVGVDDSALAVCAHNRGART